MSVPNIRPAVQVKVGDKVAMYPAPEAGGYICIPVEHAVKQGFSLEGAHIVEVVADAD